MIHRSCITVHMPRNSVVSQEQRTKNNPLVLGTFDQLSLRYLRGNLGAKYQVKTNGVGGGTYNNWFQVNLSAPAWIIVTKGPPRPTYINVSVYNLDNIPQTDLPVFQADSLTDGVNNLGNVYIPYLDTVMSVQSDLYNTFDRLRLDRGDDRYFALGVGSYLICISSTRNEPLNYEVGVVIEPTSTTQEVFWELEDVDGSVVLQEYTIDVAEIVSPVDTAVVIPPNGGAFTEALCVIESPGGSVTLGTNSTWLIGTRIPSANINNFKIELEPGDDAYYDTIHDHSLSDWQAAWSREHQDTDRFPEVFIPLTNRP